MDTIMIEKHWSQCRAYDGAASKESLDLQTKEIGTTGLVSTLDYCLPCTTYFMNYGVCFMNMEAISYGDHNQEF
ncbi:hypothetical protein WG66_006610 [Moniliophthora roreri]|nr:hypothetical protein WG66_006610 [Moniliophthora roreri]